MRWSATGRASVLPCVAAFLPPHGSIPSMYVERERRKLEGKDRRTEGKGISRREEVGGAQKGEDREQKGKEFT